MRFTIRRHIYDLAWQFYYGFVKLTPRQLKSLEHRTRALTTTNCPWLEYELRETTIRMINEVRKMNPPKRRTK